MEQFPIIVNNVSNAWSHVIKSIHKSKHFFWLLTLDVRASAFLS